MQDGIQAMYNLCGKLKDESVLFLGLYHYHTLVKLDYDRFDYDCFECDPLDEHNRDKIAFNVFCSLAKSSTESIEKECARYMVGQCYLG